MAYRDTYDFAVKRVRVHWWRLLWIIAAAAGLERLFGIRCASRYTDLKR